jgi:multicomponent Na+:H+ antiporter subunit D
MNALLLCMLIPLGGAVAVLLLGRWPNARDGATLITSVVLFSVVLGILPGVEAGGRPTLDFVEVLPGLVLGFKVEPLGMVFALVASGLWIVTSLYGFGYMRGHHEENQTRFFFCFALAIFAALGVAFSRNLFTLFTFYEVLTFSTYPLVTHHGTEEAKRAGRVYLGILVSTSVCFLLLAVIWTWHLTGTTEFTPGGILSGKVDGVMLPILLALFVFGTGKAAVMPFHRWLPAAMVAPTPVSALLHAVAVVKAGVFTVLKVIVYIFGLDLLASTQASTWLLFAASITILIASIVALTQDNLKARLAYSTVSQLSYIVLGAAFASTAGAIGAGMHIAMHAVGKITLFFCAGAVMVCAHKKNISEMHGLGKRMPWTFAAFAVGSMSIIGLPFSGGMWSKWFLGVGAFDSGHGVFAGVLMISSLLSIAYLVPVFGKAFLGTSSPVEADHHDGVHHDDHDDGVSNLERAHPLVVLPPVITAIGCVVLFFQAERLYDLLAGM